MRQKLRFKNWNLFGYLETFDVFGILYSLSITNFSNSTQKFLARAWWDEHVEMAQDGIDMNFHDTLMKVANKIEKLVCIFSTATVLNMRFPAWVS